MKILLHVCCAPCSTHVIEELKKEHEITPYFYNPNIEPVLEYEKRLRAAEEYAEKLGLKLIVSDYENLQWHESVRGLEQEPEGRKRCSKCFELRLRKTAEFAGQNGFDSFTTTLTVSPFKDAGLINAIGKRIGEDLGVMFLERDFKKKDGYMNSVKLSKENNLYRQHYCGCLFSKK